MGRWLALLSTAAILIAANAIDPCKRQPFRGRCPSVGGQPPKRSQFVLRYYARNGECVSYPYGHCISDESEPQLYRYKEECEDSCINNTPENLGQPKEHPDQTYGTVSPLKETPTIASSETKESTGAPTTTKTLTTSAAKKECERRREASASSKIRGGFVPICDSNGNFQKVQCEPDGSQCFCVNTNGIEITNSRTRNGLKPNCDKIETAVAPRSQVCTGRSDRGPCSSSYTRFFYDESTQRCSTFSYSGCGGNGNNYEAEVECVRRCVPPRSVIPVSTAPPRHDICSLPKERGPCDKYELRFYYNADTKECKYFFWGGCEGNENNFETAEACQSVCGIVQGVRIGNVSVVSAGPEVEQLPTTQPVATTTATRSTSTTQFSSQTVPTRVVSTIQTTRRQTTSSSSPTPPLTQPVTTTVPPSRPNPSVVLLPGDEDNADSANRCVHPVDSGSCRGQFVRWFWDEKKNACDVFTYSGCEGNGNNFASREECMAICHKEIVSSPITPDFSNVCKHEIDAGECQGVFQRFAFDTVEEECQPFTYGGCGGNGNNFATMTECRSKCEKNSNQAVNVCEFEIEAGECTGVFPRFAYDRETNDCRPFTYGGCGGNGNNFATISECRNVCIKKSCNPVGQCDLGRCQIVNDNRGCPFCSCSPVRLPIPPPQCPPLDVGRCKDPCIVINNRRGCQECACPQTGVLPVDLVPLPTTEARSPGSNQRATALPPASPRNIAPPAIPSRSAEPVRPPITIPGILEKENRKSALPPSLNEDLTEKCLQKMESGPCKNFVDRWFFNKEDGSCHPFKYGGCAGNRNHFFTQRECEIHCARFLQSTTVAVQTSTEASTTPSSTTARVTSTTVDVEDNIPHIDLSKIKVEGVPQQQIETIDRVSGIGRQPAGAILPPDETIDEINMDDLDEPTTIFPTTKATPTNKKTFNIHDPKIICGMPADAGICTNYVGRWFFNSETEQCEQFSFGGCGGNLNNFINRTLCELSCMAAHAPVHSQVPERCSYDKNAGFGKGYNVKWYFNMRNLRCEQFVYEGKGGNANQFETLSDCERFCSPQPTRPTQAPRPTFQTVFTETVNTSSAASPLPTAANVTTVRPTLPSTTPKQEPAIQATTDESDDEYEEEPTEDETNELPQLAPVPPFATRGSVVPEVPANPPGTEPQPPAFGTPNKSQPPLNIDQLNAQATAKKTPSSTTQRPVEVTTYKTEKLNPDVAFRIDPDNLLPPVGPSPPETVNYQTGQKTQGIHTFTEGRLPPPESMDAKNGDEKVARPSCPNGNKELRYNDGTPVMCLPGKEQCPNKSVCYFNGMDYFCCPNVEDPYDHHVFGGYGGDEARNGYKVFGPLRVRRLMDEIPLRSKRQTSMDKAFNTNPVSFNLDSVVAPLRFDADKPRHVSSASRMRRPVPPRHGNPMCILPLVKGNCNAAHLRYFYDRDSDSCRLFYYTGCQGNANNFGSLDDCQRLCVLNGQVSPAVQADAVTPATVLTPGQCPSGFPLGGSSPVLCGNSTDSIGCPTGYYCHGGPPDICCPGVDPSFKDIVQHGVKVSQQTTPKPGVPRNYYKEQLLSTPQFMCPDASDPLMAENGAPAVCGAGFDGVKMCPKGYYCAIDGAKGSRLCCPLFGSAAQRIPTESVLAPTAPRRSSDSREIIDRGSLPFDQKKYLTDLAQTTASVTEAPMEDEEYEEVDDTPQHLRVKPTPSRNNNLQVEAASQSPNATDVSSETVNIELPRENPVVEEPVQSTELLVKDTQDKSICHLKPTEGRACRDDEKAPRTNLHYFYSAKDRRCKLYFYRGCGGNANRFEKKSDCEALCLSA